MESQIISLNLIRNAGTDGTAISLDDPEDLRDTTEISASGVGETSRAQPKISRGNAGIIRARTEQQAVPDCDCVLPAGVVLRDPVLVLEKLVPRLEIDESRVEITVDKEGAFPAEQFEAATVHDGALLEPIGCTFHSKTHHIGIPILLQSHEVLWHDGWSEQLLAFVVGIVDAIVQDFTDVFVGHDAVED